MISLLECRYFEKKKTETRAQLSPRPTLEHTVLRDHVLYYYIDFDRWSNPFKQRGREHQRKGSKTMDLSIECNDFARECKQLATFPSSPLKNRALLFESG